MRFWPRKFVCLGDDGHVMVLWGDVDDGWAFLALISGWLRLRYGLRRHGKTIHSPCGTSLYPDFVGKDFRLKAGWNDAYYLRSEDDAGDRFLTRVFTGGATPGPPKGPSGPDADARDAPAP